VDNYISSTRVQAHLLVSRHSDIGKVFFEFVTAISVIVTSLLRPYENCPRIRRNGWLEQMIHGIQLSDQEYPSAINVPSSVTFLVSSGRREMT
jgi:hypothetical protein